MTEEFTAIETVKEELDTNKWVNLHVTCTELWAVGSDRMEQVGRISDGSQEDIKFISYKTSNVKTLETGESYVLKRAMTISDKDEGRAILLKADSEVEKASSPTGGASPDGPVCASCDEKMPTDAYHEDGNAPEIGWEYWHCPNCDEKMRPEALQ